MGKGSNIFNLPKHCSLEDEFYDFRMSGMFITGLFFYESLWEFTKKHIRSKATWLGRAIKY
eukprot:snap_masked-scaffold_7-processed-gene-11.30-mRNA-1 protein AED:1.00 eAED:1.00 QI:0/0/0/0/1/1/2/0/60